MLADQVAGPPQALEGIAGPAAPPQSAEQRTPHAVGALGRVGEQVGHLGRVVPGEHLGQAGGGSAVPDRQQPLPRRRRPGGLVQPGQQIRFEPGERRRDDRRRRLAQARRAAADVAGEEVQAEDGQAFVGVAVPQRVHSERLARIPQPAGRAASAYHLRQEGARGARPLLIGMLPQLGRRWHSEATASNMLGSASQPQAQESSGRPAGPTSAGSTRRSCSPARG